jgi:hypothetical protein
MNKLIYFSIIFLLAGVTFAQKDILVNWECNMEFEIASLRFDPAADTVAASGDFNGWGRKDFIPDPGDPNYYINVPTEPDTVFQAEVGDTIIAGYKFRYTPGTWETGDNRIHILTQAEYDAETALISRSFNDGSVSTLTNQESTVTFNVDVNNAVSAINGLPFPVVNSVVLCGANAPLQWPGGGWPDGDIGLTIPLTDQGGGIWSADVIFPIYTPFEIQYKYGINYGDDLNNGGGNDNENSVGTDHFITLFSSFWNGVVDNVFGTMGNHTFTTDVKNITNTMPTSYALEQNFPNPFNPATRINFSIPNEGIVTLNVYNSLGQQVATLVNESKPAGTYQVDFDGADLTSGVYFYKISSGNFTQTKKMILMK